MPAEFGAKRYAQQLARRRAHAIATKFLYFPVRSRLLEAIDDGRLTVLHLGGLDDGQLLARIGVKLSEIEEPE